VFLHHAVVSVIDIIKVGEAIIDIFYD